MDSKSILSANSNISAYKIYILSLAQNRGFCAIEEEQSLKAASLALAGLMQKGICSDEYANSNISVY